MMIVREYRLFLENNADPVRAEKEKAYLYSDLKHYGVSVPKKTEFWSKHRGYIKKLSKKETLSLVKELWKQGSHEERSSATGILSTHAKKLDIKDIPFLEKLIRESKGWALLDNFVIQVMPEIINKDKKTYNVLKRWAKDDDFWVRRSALLSQLLFFRSGSGGNKQLFFDMAKSQFSEKWIDKIYKDKLTANRAKFFIRKAIGWTLREMGKKDQKSVYKFLKENKKEMSGLSFREGCKSLSERLKNLL